MEINISKIKPLFMKAYLLSQKLGLLIYGLLIYAEFTVKNDCKFKSQWVFNKLWATLKSIFQK